MDVLDGLEWMLQCCYKIHQLARAVLGNSKQWLIQSLNRELDIHLKSKNNI